MIIMALIVFSILIIVHEFGHYIVAKKSGVLVEEFSIGMGPKLFGKQKNETMYSIRLFPIGGYCKMLGDDSESNDDRAFNNKSVSKRIAVVLAGAFMNFVLAFLIIFVLKSINGYIPPVVNSLIDGYPAQMAGIKTGDTIKAINGSRIRIYEDLNMIMLQNKDKPVLVTLQRGNETIEYNVAPKLAEDGSQWLLGFKPEGYIKGGVFKTIEQSFWNLIFYIKYTIVSFVQLFTLQVSTDDMAGPIGIINIMGESYQNGLKYSVSVAIQSVAEIAALISANLGVVNLLPLPALDGGRLMFLLIEAIRRKPISAEKEGMVHFVGFVALMILAVFIAYNDILRLF